MSKSYVIQWKSLVNGRSGRGHKLFELDAAQRLANELNEEYPEIQHEPMEAELHAGPAPGSHESEPAEQLEGGCERPQVTRDRDPALSLP